MNEDKKINENNSIKIPQITLTHEIKEVCLNKKNPEFNLVSLKARHRLNIFKKIFSKHEYKDYIRKCKNMYSISSLMNNHCSLSDLYNSERINIPEIINLYNKIDINLDQRKITLKKIRNNKYNLKNINDFNKNNIMSLSDTNLLGNNCTNNEFNNLIKGVSLSESKNNFFDKSKNDRIKTLCYNVKKSDFLALKSRNNIIHLNTRSNDNKNNSTYYSSNDNKIKNKIYDYNDSNILNANYMSDNNKSNSSKKYNNNYFGRNNKIFRAFFPKYKISETKKNKKINIIEKKIEKTNDADFKTMLNIKSANFPLSNKYKGYSITHFGAIKYNNSIFRNKGIENYLPDYYNLPILYRYSNMNKKINEK
jgi:hypothetical protein